MLDIFDRSLDENPASLLSDIFPVADHTSMEGGFHRLYPPRDNSLLLSKRFGRIPGRQRFFFQIAEHLRLLQPDFN